MPHATSSSSVTPISGSSVCDPMITLQSVNARRVCSEGSYAGLSRQTPIWFNPEPSSPGTDWARDHPYRAPAVRAFVLNELMRSGACKPLRSRGSCSQGFFHCHRRGFVFGRVCKALSYGGPRADVRGRETSYRGATCGDRWR